MASDKFEVGDILVCVDGSAHGGFGGGLEVGKIYEVERPNGCVCLLVGSDKSWFCRRFRRATLDEIRKYRKGQGYEKHQFAIGELVVGIVQDHLLPVIGQTHVVSATRSDCEHECFIDIDGGEVAGPHFAAKFRKATPAEAAAYRKANGGPPFKAAPAVKNGAPADSIDSVEIGDEIVFVGPSNKNGREYGTIATVQGVIYKSGSEIHELRIHVPGDGWSYTTPDSWVPVGRGYELVARGQPIHTGDEWLEAGRWNRTSFRTEQGWTKGTIGILRRKVKEDAVTVQIGNHPPFKAVLLDPPTFNLSFTWEGPEKKPLTAHDAPEEISKAIRLPNPQCLTSADGREFDIIDWNPKVQTGEIVKVEANLMPKLAKGPKPKATPFKKGDIVVCIDPLAMLTLGKTYRIEQIGLVRGLRIEGVSRPEYLCPSRFRPATVSEITRYWEKLGFPNHQFKAGDIVVCVDARPYDSTVDPDEVVEPEEGKAYKVEDVRGCDIKPSGCVCWNRVRFRLATPAEAQAFLDEKAAEAAAQKQLPKEPGIGYRFLDKDELVVEGDEYWSPTYGGWTASGQWQFGHDGKQSGGMTYRRRNQFAEGELVQIVKPATQALRDGCPVWVGPMGRLGGKVLEMPKELGPSYSSNACIGVGGWGVSVNWLAPASSKQKEAFQAEKDKKAKVQELEDKMKAIESELAILKGT